MTDVQADPTDTGTLRPKRKPLQKKGTQFIPMDCPPFEPQVILPTHVSPSNALGIFSLYFSDPILENIVQSTNKHVERAPSPKQPNARAHEWVPLTVQELRTYLGIIIYQGLHIEKSLKDYYNKAPDTLFHPVIQYMSLRQFQALYRQFRIWDPDNRTDIWSQVCVIP